MILYILKSSVLLLILITVYRLFLENEKMHKFNRIYLLGSLIFGLIIPLQLFSFKTKSSSSIHQFELKEMLLQKTNTNLSSLSDNQMIIYSCIVVYVLITLLLSVRFLVNLYSFYKKIKTNARQTIHGVKVILIPEAVVPHSFLDTIFISEQDFTSNTIAPELLAHETAHIQQKHTLDILFIEILQILLWFNPILLRYKNAIKLNHEFLADEKVNTTFLSVSHYQNMLLNFASNSQKIALASAINYSITKKRLVMMTKKESKIRIILKTIGVGFVYSLLFFSFSPETLAQEKAKNKQNIDLKEAKSIAKITQPKFPGGVLAFYKFVGANFKIPTELKGGGKIYLTFMVEKDGSLSEFEILKDVGFGSGEEVIRVLKLSPKWIPGKENNETVRVKYSLPIQVEAVK